jgi:hypothetical protein
MTQLAPFKRFCSEILELELERFQERIVKEVLSPRREALILLPRGNVVVAGRARACESDSWPRRPK